MHTYRGVAAWAIGVNGIAARCGIGIGLFDCKAADGVSGRCGNGLGNAGSTGIVGRHRDGTAAGAKINSNGGAALS